MPTTTKSLKQYRYKRNFRAGQQAWVAYLQYNLNTRLARRCIKLAKGQQDSAQTVIVSFLVDKQGNIADVKAVNIEQVHPKIAEEAVRVIQQGPKWLPATMAEAKGVYRQRQAITFQVTRD